MNRDNSKEIPNLSDIRLLDIDTGAEWSRFCKNAGIKEAKTFRLSSLWKIAASIILIAGTGLFAYKMNSAEKAENYIASGTAIETTVETSTQISLNKYSSISCTDDRSNGKYNVRLKGEAYFDVEKNPSRTFEITTQDITVTVHGTSFDICESDGNTIVTVTSGNVGVRNNANNKSVENLTRGKQLICDKQGNMSVTDVENFNSIAWKLKKLEFNNTSLKQIMADLSIAYDFKYEFADSGIESTTLTGTFDNQNLESVFTIIGQALDITIEQQTEGCWTIRK